MSRMCHFVGSIPAKTTEDAMRSMLDWAGPHVRSITDGEVGDRYHWIVNLINGFSEHPDLVLVRKGDWTSFDDTPKYRVRRGHTLTADALDLRHDTDALAALPAFRKLRAERGRDDLSFQVGIPGDLDLSLFTFGPAGAFQHRAVFREVLGREMRRVHAEAGDDVIFQIEVPVELIFVCRMPGPLRAAMAGFLAGGVARLAREAPAGARFGLHLCLGDLNHENLGKLSDARPFVQLANALVRRWPADRPLEYVHAPFTGGTDPAPTDRAFYAPLRDLKLGADTRFVAGLVQETSSESDLRHAVELADAAHGQPVDVAASCGLARRSPEDAAANAELARRLCEPPA
ncbi:hypothetical protein [Actinoallomurus iriomotensis]|uniref:Uncharacterized protein n=1 Tax=Actinoallomurus iriomotensis TaxID=478107 RepID=A0A9W6VW30_9ACTN|nr:hypothetical protein [Actinoallomurus iriomotensis]GLY82430.1 hypothetical protein Airi02_003620 [Actinoallomurus iriomotensis]